MRSSDRFEAALYQQVPSGGTAQEGHEFAGDLSVGSVAGHCGAEAADLLHLFRQWAEVVDTGGNLELADLLHADVGVTAGQRGTHQLLTLDLDRLALDLLADAQALEQLVSYEDAAGALGIGDSRRLQERRTQCRHRAHIRVSMAFGHAYANTLFGLNEKNRHVENARGAEQGEGLVGHDGQVHRLLVLDAFRNGLR